jgi:hypothetical protein
VLGGGPPVTSSPSWGIWVRFILTLVVLAGLFVLVRNFG